MNLSARLEELIARKGVTQRVVADACGLSAAALTQYLQGRTPKSDELLRIATYFGVTMEWLLMGDKYGGHASVMREDPPDRWRDRAVRAEHKVEVLKAGLEALLKKI